MLLGDQCAVRYTMCQSVAIATTRFFLFCDMEVVVWFVEDVFFIVVVAK